MGVEGGETCCVTLITGVLLVLLCVYKLIQLVFSQLKIQDYNNIRRTKIEKINQINSKWVQRVSKQLAAEEAVTITKLPFETLQKRLQNGELTAAKALQAYQYVAAQQNAKYNFMCEPVQEAEDQASKLDALTAEERHQLPLFGVPISLKENYFLEGYDTTVGCAHLIDKPSKETSLLVAMLRAHGAVPFMRTNIPQTCMSFDSTNPIYGKTHNPHRINRSCGGSSGGEGSAIGSGSSVLGFGSDVGGSLRIPAAFCGIYSLKPTAGRLTFRGDFSIDGNERIITITVGPMGRDVNALVEAMKVFSTPASHVIDPYVPPVPFNLQEFNSKRKLRIGYFHSAGPIEVSEACRRAVDTAVKGLQGAGHEVVLYEPPDVVWAMSVAFVSNLFADDCSTLANAVKYDILESHIKESVYLSYIPLWIRKLFAATIGHLLLPQYFLNYLNSSGGPGSVANFWEGQAKIKEYRRKVLNELQQREIDVLICTSMPVPALRIGECKDATGAMTYMGLFNLLNLPSGIVPISKVTEEDIRRDMEAFPPKDMYHKAMKSNLQGSEGLPVAVQCVSLPFHEERCLRVMKELEDIVGYNVLNELPESSG